MYFVANRKQKPMPHVMLGTACLRGVSTYLNLRACSRYALPRCLAFSSCICITVDLLYPKAHVRRGIFRDQKCLPKLNSSRKPNMKPLVCHFESCLGDDSPSQIFILELLSLSPQHIVSIMSLCLKVATWGQLAATTAHGRILPAVSSGTNIPVCRYAFVLSATLNPTQGKIEGLGESDKAN